MKKTKSLFIILLFVNITCDVKGIQVGDDNKTQSDKISLRAGTIKFEDDFSLEHNSPRDHVSFEDQPSRKPFKFESELSSDLITYNQNKPNDYQNTNVDQHNVKNIENIRFQDNNNVDISSNANQYNDFKNEVDNNEGVKVEKPKKRRRRRRKPRLQQYPGQGYGLIGSRPGQFPPLRQNPYPGPLPAPYPGALPGSYPGAVPGAYYPPHQPRPSIAEEAISSVTNALTSIARYDDYQCVPRLLCEVAGGRAPTAGTGTTGVLQTIVNLQPLITLLAAYNGVSTSPLFVFGRAALLGMTSKDNAGTCHYAYPQCPTDPEKLVEYLNTYNGGFFRFFNEPQQFQGYGQQNLEQFYNHLSNFQGQQPQSIPQDPQNLPQQYISNAIPNQFGGTQNYGLYNDPNVGNNIKPNIYNNNQYGLQYPYGNEINNKYGYNKYNQYKNNEIGTGDNRIGKRIQNRPDITYVDTKLESSNDNYKWTFPETFSNNKDETTPPSQRFGRTVKFPNQSNILPDNKDNIKTAKGFQFPETQSNRQYVDYYDYPPYTQVLNTNNFKLDENGFYVESDDFEKGNFKKDEGVEVVYVLRGNGDPNKPEIVKLRPGQKL